MEHNTLEDIVRTYIPLGRPNTLGWHPVLCKVCNDSGRKGKRAAFKFEEGAVAYHCFNCSHTAVFNENAHSSMPDKMQTVLNAFSVPSDEWQKIAFDAFVKNVNSETSKITKRSATADIEPAEITLPPFFSPVTDDPTDDWSVAAIDYLSNERGVDWKTHPFYVVRKTKHPDVKRWYGRIIIPMYKDKKLIFYQGRDLTGMHVKKYLSPNIPKNNILVGYEHIMTKTDDPLYITEGWFDAYHIQGVAVLGNELTTGHIKWINRSHRPKVVIPDRFGDGYLLADQALKNGWAISTPFMDSDIKDVNEGVVKYGLFYTLQAIINNTAVGFQAETNLAVYCERKKNKNDRNIT